MHEGNLHWVMGMSPASRSNAGRLACRCAPVELAVPGRGCYPAHGTVSSELQNGDPALSPPIKSIP